jgi:hypothetical protein
MYRLCKIQFRVCVPVWVWCWSADSSAFAVACTESRHTNGHAYNNSACCAALLQQLLLACNQQCSTMSTHAIAVRTSNHIHCWPHVLCTLCMHIADVQQMSCITLRLISDVVDIFASCRNWTSSAPSLPPLQREAPSRPCTTSPPPIAAPTPPCASTRTTPPHRQLQRQQQKCSQRLARAKFSWVYTNRGLWHEWDQKSGGGGWCPHFWPAGWAWGALWPPPHGVHCASRGHDSGEWVVPRRYWLGHRLM